MEPKFQNTFIPKKPIVTKREEVTKPSSSNGKRKVSFLGLIGVLVFVLTLAAAGGVFGYTKFLENDISQKDILLQEEIAKLEPDLIEEIRIADQKLELAERVLGAHFSPSRFFEHLESITLQKVRFTDLVYGALPGSRPTINIAGVAGGYNTVALQSDILSRDSFILNSSFSDLSLSETGDVLFQIEAEVSDDLILYAN